MVTHSIWHRPIHPVARNSYQPTFYRKDDVERELEEFQENSQMLEKELENSLEQAEKLNRDLRQRNSRLSAEVDQLRSRLDQQTSDCSLFQNRAQELEAQHQTFLKYIREIEQKNDDLERAQRYRKFHFQLKRQITKLNGNISAIIIDYGQLDHYDFSKFMYRGDSLKILCFKC